MSQAAVGIDVGGTRIKAGLVDDSGRLLFQTAVDTPPRDSSTQAVVDRIAGAGREACAAAERLGQSVLGVGFGTPAYSLGDDWVQTQSANIPALEGFPLRPAMQAAFGPSVACDLDTNVATIAEYRFGAGKNYGRLIFMGIGTGISCGIVVDGELLRYTFGTAGDTGHLIVDPDGARSCTCGGHGCLEAVASARAIREAGLEAVAAGRSPALAALLKRNGAVDAHDVTEAARQGDAEASSILGRAGDALGVAIASLMHIFCPEAVLIGGGVSRAGDLLLEPARRAIGRLASPFYANQLRALQPAALGSDAGVVGAATLILSRHGRFGGPTGIPRP